MSEEPCFRSKKILRIRETVNSIRLQIHINCGNEWNILCAIMDRVEETTKFLDEIKSDAKVHPFKLYDLLVHGNTVLDCLIKLNEMIGNGKIVQDFKAKNEVFTEHYQLSDNLSYLKELNNKVLKWYGYCKGIVDEFPESKVKCMSSSEKEILKQQLLYDIEALTADDMEYEEQQIIEDREQMHEVEAVNSWIFPRVVESCYESDDYLSDHEKLKKIIYPTGEWRRLTEERLLRNVNGQKESDYEYFKFLRSVCAVHPIETTAHPMYMRPGSVCTFVDHRVFDPSGIAADYHATIYSAKGDSSIPINVDQIISFLKKSFDYLAEEAVKGLHQLSKEEIESFRKKRMMVPGEDYMLYLKQLLDQVEVRYGYDMYIVKHWIRIFKTQYTGPVMNEYLENYKQWLKEKIAISHEEIQEMRWDSESWSLTLFDENLSCIDGYGLSKIGALYESEELIEDIWGHQDEEFLDEDYALKMLSEIDRLRFLLLSPTPENRDEYQKLYDGMSGTEFARYQLSRMRTFLMDETGITLNFKYGDWHLHLQYMISIWIYKTKSGSLLSGNDRV